jgi:hypothetical protein
VRIERAEHQMMRCMTQSGQEFTGDELHRYVADRISTSTCIAGGKEIKLDIGLS